jgi:neutral ceramidase
MMKWNWGFLCAVVVSGIFLTSCAGTSVVVQPPPPTGFEAGTGFLAGAAETDITPPPGLPVFGFSVMGEGKIKGYWTRLKSRAIVFQYKKGNTGKRFALVQIDWGAVSGLVYWKVAEKIARLGFKPGDFLISASHTHAAPGGFFGYLFYNAFAGGEICINCYLAPVVEWMTTQIAKSIEDAVNDLEPALVGASDVMIPGISRNRSKEAWILNFKDDPLAIPYDKVLPRFHVIRVDHLLAGGVTRPRAAFITAPLHATSVSQENIYYHGDLFGVASRYMAKLVYSNQDFNLEKPFIAAVVPGPQGDVSPNYSRQGRDEAKRIGKEIAEKVFPVFNRLTGKLKTVTIDTAYIERKLNNAEVGIDKDGNKIKLAEKPVVGVPIMGGTEDGRWDHYGSFGVFEGHTRFPQGDHGVKLPLGSDIRFQEIVFTKDLPNIAALQVVRLKDVITLAAIPGEPTMETGRLIKQELEKIDTHENTAVVAVANEYMSYIATCPEYQAQHFEGAFTLFGEHESRYFRQELAKMAKGMSDNNAPEKLKYNKRVFKPGSPRKVFNLARKVRPYKWEPVPGKDGKNIVTLTDESLIRKNDLRAFDSDFFPVSFHWKGLKTGRMDSSLPGVSIECNGVPLINAEGVLESDDWLNFIVRRKGWTRRWTATWTPPKGLDPNAEYRFKLERPGELPPLYSDTFRLTRK